MKVMTIVGTRPELIKLSETIKKFDEFFDHIFVHTGQNYDYSLNKVFFEDFGLREPDYYLDVNGNNLGNTIGNVISKSYDVIDIEKPEAIVLLGDTNSCLSVISAKRLKVPIFHLEAGNRCFDENLPEEINRKIIDHTSDINLCYTQHAKQNLINEGVAVKDIFVVGSPMAEILNKYKQNIENNDVINKYKLLKNKYFVFSAHREENIDNTQNLNKLLLSIEKIASLYDLPIIFSVHPRTRKKLKELNIKLSEKIILTEPMGFFEYIKLQKNSLCVLSDSGTLSEEASFFKFPAVSIRNSTERPESIDSGNLILGGQNSKNIIEAINIAVKLKKIELTGSEIKDYSDTNFSLKVLKIVQSYANIVDDLKWNKGSDNDE